VITTGIVRRFDDLGRIVIPKEIREKAFGKRDVYGMPMEIFYDNDKNIILKSYKNGDDNE
jgi:AbrB family transcriptional regulator (stage V sporulation protein T)